MKHIQKVVLEMLNVEASQQAKFDRESDPFLFVGAECSCETPLCYVCKAPRKLPR